jgi:hypothetical protein
MSYEDLLFDVTDDDEEINELSDKAFEKFIDSNKSINLSDIKVKIYKTSDELDDVDYMKSIGYKLKEINHYKNLHVAIIIFVKEGEIKNAVF